MMAPEADNQEPTAEKAERADEAKPREDAAVSSTAGDETNPARRKRGPWFGVSVTLGVVVGVPLGLYLLLHILAHMGLAQTIVNVSLEDTFGSGAKVETVELGGLSSANGKELVLPSRDDQTKPAVEADKVDMEWDLWDLIAQQRIESMRVEKPRFELRRNEEGKWNFRLGKKGAPRVKIEQMFFQDGTFVLKWSRDSGISIDKIEGVILHPGGPLARTVTLKGVLPSQNKLSASMRIGTNRSFAGSAEGSLDVKEDLGDALPAGWDLTGQLQFRFDARRAGTAAEDAENADPGETSFYSRVEWHDVRLPVCNGQALALTERDLGFQGRVKFPTKEPEPAPYTLQELRLHMEDVFEARLPLGTITSDTGILSAQQGRLRLDLEGFRSLFTPRLLGTQLETSGEVCLNNIKVTAPLCEDLKSLQLKCDLEASKVGLGYPGLGALPSLALSGRLSCEKGIARLSDATAALGKLASITVETETDIASGLPDLTGLLGSAKLTTLEADLERLADYPIGRRILAGHVNDLMGPAPDKAELPFLFGGRITARGSGVESRQEKDMTVLSLGGIKLHGLRFLRWPIEWPVPDLTISGDIGAEAHMQKGSMKSLRLKGSLRSSSEPPISAQLGMRFDAGKTGNLYPKSTTLHSLAVPVDAIAKRLGLSVFGLKWEGILSITNASYDLATGDLEGDLQLVDVGVKIPLLFTSLENVFVKGRVRIHQNAINVSGRLDSAEIVKFYFYRTRALPTQFKLNVHLPTEREGLKADLKTKWGEAHHFDMDAAWIAGGDEPSKVKGSVKSSMLGGLDCDYDCGLDIEQPAVGPLVLTARNVDLSAVHTELRRRKMLPSWELSGRAPSLRLELGRLTERDIKRMLIRAPESALDGVLSGRLKGAHIRHIPTQSEAERLSGTFLVKFDTEKYFSLWTINGILKLDDYEALLARHFYLPPPATGGKGEVQLVTVMEAGRNRVWSARLDKLNVTLSDLLDVRTTGRLQIPPSGDMIRESAGSLDIKVTVPDLAKTHKLLSKPNLRIVAPRLADMELAGKCAYEGKHLWDQDRRAMTGAVQFDKVSLSIGKKRNLSLRNLNGSLPLSFFKSDSLWPAEWPREQRASMTVASAHYPPLKMPQQAIGVISVPNVLSVKNALRLDVPGGKALIKGLRAEQLLSPRPAFRFDLALEKIDLEKLAELEGWSIKGLRKKRKPEEAWLKGTLTDCALIREPGPVGSWTFESSGEFVAERFFAGTLTLGDFYARGLFGPVPVWGCRARADRLDFGLLTRRNPQLGRLDTVADLKLEDLSVIGTRLEDVQSGRLELLSVPREGKTDYYNGKWAMLTARDTMNQALREAKVSQGMVMEMRFGFERLGLGLTLKAGQLIGPKPRLPGDLIINGKGLYSPDIKGRPNDMQTWESVVARIRAHEARLRRVSSQEDDAEDENE